MDRRRGFTLVELLVVIAIIALLMSILMPTLGKVKRQAKAVACMSNLGQWGKIFLMYTNNSDGCFMGGWHKDPSEAWLHALRSYFGEAGGITCCPMAFKVRGASNKSGGTFTAWGVFSEAIWYGEGNYGSYGISSTIYNVPNNDICHWRCIETKEAAIIPVFLDAIWIDSWVWYTNEPPPCENLLWTETGGIGRFCINRHDGFVNVLFMDFSVRKIGLKQLWKLKWNRRYDIHYPEPDWPDWMKRFKDYDDAYE